MSAWPDGNNYPENYVRFFSLKTWLMYSTALTWSFCSRTYLLALFLPIVSFNSFLPLLRLIISLSPQCIPRTNLGQLVPFLPFHIRCVQSKEFFVTRIPPDASSVGYQASNPGQPCGLHCSSQVSLPNRSHSLAWKLNNTLSTPWKRILVYDVPANMPPCPPGGCICAVSRNFFLFIT